MNSTERSRSGSQSSAVQATTFLNKICFWRKLKTPPEKAHRIVVPNHTVLESTPKKLHPNSKFTNNRIRTTKYTFLSFIPKNLFEQFHRFANLYFLGIVLLNWLPVINAFGKEISMIPVLFVMGVTAIKDAFEDRRRYISDKRVNNYTCRVYSKSASRYVKTLWKNVKVGDIVHLSCNEIIPADILLLRSSGEQGLCYIETSNLDGETNLKQRQVVRGLFSTQHASFHPTEFQSTVECDPPNNKIYRFNGFIHQKNGEKISVSKDNLLLRDCLLKNTDFVEGIVVYAGHETKAMLNNGGPRYKRSKLERLMNRDVIGCIFILILLCSIGATGSGLWLASYENKTMVPFIPFESPFQYNPIMEGIFSFLTYIIILQVMIPLSLYVTIEIIKLGQVYHIHQDRQLCDDKSKKHIECRALNIPEELGQVEFVFSDKTGTLTENRMIFQRCAIGGVDYSHHLPELADNAGENQQKNQGTEGDPKIRYEVDPVFTLNPSLKEELSKLDMQIHIESGTTEFHLSLEKQRLRDFFILMAVCNTVVVSKYPHKDQMNSSGLYLNTLANTPNSHHHHMGNGDRSISRSVYSRLENQLETPPHSATSTPTHRPHHLLLPSSRCSTPTPTPSPGELRPIYEAESPDEIALVDAAYRYNCSLIRRTPDSAVVVVPGEGLVEFKVLHVLPFDSVRKRMSVIIQHPINKQRVLYCKGADSAIFTRLAPTSDPDVKNIILKTQQHLNSYSRHGLRILCMAKKVLSDEEYNEWLRQHNEAQFALDDREQKLFESANKIEKNLELLGATGIEDRLQEGVPECIAALRAAGIVLWVLTGDKQETAVNIAYSCRLFSMDMEIITLNARSKEATEETIRFYLDQVQKDFETVDPTSSPSSATVNVIGSILPGNHHSAITRLRSQRRRKRALVIDGKTLAFVLERNLDRLFLELAQNCSAVLCCRVTPLQKSYVVKMAKDRLGVLTLAIGDGANDVSMIQTADVGIGISGQEGMQAVMASDFAIPRFRYLERLLLVHGHWCYDRLARTVLYFFYKNASFIYIIFWYQLYCGFTGNVMIDQLYLMLFNVLFTALPPLVLGVYDQDCPANLLLGSPSLYARGRRSQIYTQYSFWITMLDALYQSVVIFFVPVMAYHDTDVGIWEFGTTVLSGCVLVQLIHVSIETKAWTGLHVLSLGISVMIYYLFAFIYNRLAVGTQALQNPYMVIHHAVQTPIYWFSLALICVLGCMPRLVIRSVQSTLCPSSVVMTLLIHKAQRRSSNKSMFSVSWSCQSSEASIIPSGARNNAVHSDDPASVSSNSGSVHVA